MEHKTHMGYPVIIRIRGPKNVKIAWDQLVSKYQKQLDRSSITYGEVIEEVLREKGLLEPRGKVF